MPSGGKCAEGPRASLSLDALRKLNFDVSSSRSKSWSEFAPPDAPQLDFVFTDCAIPQPRTCPVWPGAADHRAWGVPIRPRPPAARPKFVLAFADTLPECSIAVSPFLLSLPLRSLDTLTLQKHFELIGQPKDAGETPATAAE